MYKFIILRNMGMHEIKNLVKKFQYGLGILTVLNQL